MDALQRAIELSAATIKKCDNDPAQACGYLSMQVIDLQERIKKLEDYRNLPLL